jgi:hypothetical protein
LLINAGNNRLHVFITNKLRIPECGSVRHIFLLQAKTHFNGTYF